MLFRGWVHAAELFYPLHFVYEEISKQSLQPARTQA